MTLQRATPPPERGIAGAVLMLCVSGLGAGCGPDAASTARDPPRGIVPTAPLTQTHLDGQAPAIDLLDNRASLLTYAAGTLVIDTGTPAFATLIEGGYQAPWHLSGTVGSRLAAIVDGLAGELFVPLMTEEKTTHRTADGGLRIGIYARSAVASQLASVFFNEHKLADVPMLTTEWRWYVVTAPADAIRDGDNKLRFYFKSAGTLRGIRSAAAIGQLALGGIMPTPAAGPLVVADAGVVTVAGNRRDALTMPAAGCVALTTWLPEAAPTLRFAVATAGNASVRVAVGDAAPVIVWNADGQADMWKSVAIDLSPYAGRVARVELVSTEMAHWAQPVISHDPAALSGGPATVRKRSGLAADHIIVWTVSSWRADHLEGVAPAMAEFAAGAARFDDYIAAAPEPFAAHAALIGGRHARTKTLAANAISLGQRLHDAGYTTALISGNGFVHDGAGFSKGFDVYSNPLRRGLGHSARALWQEARAILAREADGRTLLYIATSEPHLPYTPPPERIDEGAIRTFDPAQTTAIAARLVARTRHLTAEEIAYVRALYAAEVRAVDAAFATMLADLETLGVRDRTAVVVVGDHGEQLFERGTFGHGYQLDQASLATPLVISWPEAVSAGRVQGRVSSVDVHATIIDMAGLPPTASAQGDSILERSLLPSRVVIANLPGRMRAALSKRYKLIVPRVGARELYDLVQDPRETTNLFDKPAVRHIQRALRAAFGLRVGYESAWSARRWGPPNNVRPAFADDHAI